ncbi:MAG: transglycosylase SLT domain-containing protein [Rhizobiaceae bacterium]|nr:transglycosylase SLT domain-containing protein [Rhizobiaceae bacterium]
MKKLTFATAVLAAGLPTFAADASANETANLGKSEGVRCFLLGCYDENNNRVERPGAETAKASAEAQAPKAATDDRYGSIITKHASANGIEVNLARAIIRIESNYRANARGQAGEVGLMQIKPATARAMGYRGSVRGLYDPETNITYGMRYLGMAQKLGDGSLCGTILKYNAGHGANRMNRISAAYCTKVRQHLGIS